MESNFKIHTDSGFAVTTLEVNDQNLFALLKVQGFQLTQEVGQPAVVMLKCLATSVEIDGVAVISQFQTLDLDTIDAAELEQVALGHLGSMDGGADTIGHAYLLALKEIINGDE